MNNGNGNEIGLPLLPGSRKLGEVSEPAAKTVRGWFKDIPIEQWEEWLAHGLVKDREGFTEKDLQDLKENWQPHRIEWQKPRYTGVTYGGGHGGGKTAAQIEELTSFVTGYKAVASNQDALIAERNKRIAELEDALRPFAEARIRSATWQRDPSTHCTRTNVELYQAGHNAATIVEAFSRAHDALNP